MSVVEDTTISSRTVTHPCDLNWMRMAEWPSRIGESARTCSLVDLFCGCGGLSLGIWESLRLHGYELQIKLAVDNSAQALGVYRANFGVPDAVAVASDIAELVPGEVGSEPNEQERALAERLGDLDILAAGPPCQGHSDLNNSTRRDDPRNLLYLRAVRFAELTNPKIVIIENVPTAIHDKGKVIEKSQVTLRRLGYIVQPLFVDASRLGLPQTRKRHLLVAAKSNALTAEIRLDEHSAGTLQLYIHDIMDEYTTKTGMYYTPSGMSKENKRRVRYLFDNQLDDLPDSERPKCHKDEDHSYVSMYGRLSWEKPSQTITSGFGSMGQGRFIHPEKQRVLTPHEAARIQGFPDFFDFSSVTHRTALHEMIGNAVPPRVAAMIIDKLFELKIL